MSANDGTLALRLVEERYQSIFRNTSAGMVLGFPDGGLIEVNPAFCSFLGYGEEDLLQLTVEEITHPDDRDVCRWQRQTALNGGGSTCTCEKRFLRKDGSTVWGQVSGNWSCDADGRPVYFAGLIQDITGRKRMEAALRESEEKFAKAFRTTPTVLVISTLAEGRYLEVNETFEQLTGYRREEAIGRTSLELDIWEKPEARTRFLQTVRKEGRVRNLEARFRSRGGAIFVGLLSAEVIEVGGEECLLVLVNDVTERKRMEEEIALLNSDLASHAIELEAVNRELEAFNFSVSHDLCSPLTAIHGYCQLLLDLCGDRLGDQGSGFVREIYKAVENMDELITTMLNFSHLARSAMTPEPVDLTGMAKTVAAKLKMTEPQREVTISVADGIKGEGDAKLLRVVLENLLGNAWKYTGRQETAVIEFGALEIEGTPAFFVRDNGPGFDMAHADKLFSPFQRLPGARGFAGHGIGLATVQRIIQRHGGRVWAEGEPGQGAAFYFTL